MVHALVEIHRVLAPGGTLVDARPDSRVLAYVERVTGRRFKVFGEVQTRMVELASDRSADEAIERAVRIRLFRSRRRGRFWHRVRFANLAEVRRYLSGHLRFLPRAHWTVDRAARRQYADSQYVIRRGVRFELFERVTAPQGRLPQ